MTASQVRREPLGATAKSTQVNDPAHTRLARGGGEDPRGGAVLFLERAADPIE